MTPKKACSFVGCHQPAKRVFDAPGGAPSPVPLKRTVVKLRKRKCPFCKERFRPKVGWQITCGARKCVLSQSQYRSKRWRRPRREQLRAERRRWYRSLTPDQLKRIRARQRAWAKNQYWLNVLDERRKHRQRAKAWRHSMDPIKRSRYLAKQREYHKKRRASLTPEQRRRKIEQDRERRRGLQGHNRQHYLAKAREQNRKTWAAMTPAQRAQVRRRARDRRENLRIEKLVSLATLVTKELELIQKEASK